MPTISRLVKVKILKKEEVCEVVLKERALPKSLEKKIKLEMGR